MPEIKPFAAIRYDFGDADGDLSALLAPPYDVLNQDDKNRLVAKSEHNIVAIDLPHIPPKSAGPPEVYERSATALNAWLGEGVLVRETKPALYLYHQVFEYAGQSYTRQKFIARVRLAPFTDGKVLPHELTFGGPKEDRLALMKATRCQLSPIFGLFTDPEDHVGAAFKATTSRKPDAAGTLDGIENRVWIVHDDAVIDAAVSHLAGRPVYIADGHHRYDTALMYQEWATASAGGSLPTDHPANYIMFVLASMDDPGCMILPYYRALADIDVATVMAAWSAGVETTEGDDADLVLHEGRTGERTRLRFTNRAALKSLEPDQCEPWYDLDYAYLHRYLIDELLTTKLGSAAKVRYAKSLDDATATAKDENGVALLTKATPIAHLRAVSEAGGLMPQKSTYFFPKLATGVAINPLE